MTEELTEADKQAAAKQDEETRRLARINLEETERRKDDWAQDNLAKLSNSQYREFILKKFGYDPGV